MALRARAVIAGEEAEHLERASNKNEIEMFKYTRCLVRLVDSSSPFLHLLNTKLQHFQS